MGWFTTFKTLFVVHLFLGYIFVVSGLIVNFMQLLTYIFIWPWNKDLYRRIICNLGYLHWCQMVTLAQWWSGSECTIHLSDPYDLKYYGKEHSIVVMNHKYDIDWLMTWILSERLALLGGTRIYGKSTLRYVPLIGWAWIFVETIFLYRNWEKDKAIIAKGIQTLTEYPENYYITLLLFPEGTRFTEEKHKKSMEVARQKGLPELKHHLLPRTKGFVETIFALKGKKKKFRAIYDLNVGFRPDGADATLLNIINGKPCKSEIYARRIPIEDVPAESEEACAKWLHNLFMEKDEIHENFTQNGKFTIGTKLDVAIRPHDFVVSMIWLILLGVPLFRFLTNIFLYGSFTSQLILLGVIGIFWVIVRKMIAVTEIEKGSSYGAKAKNKTSNNNKKEE